MTPLSRSTWSWLVVVQLSAVSSFDQPSPPPPAYPPGLPSGTECPGSCFFISEYVEPADSSTDGFIEFYNGCDSAVNLKDYKLLLCRDGCDSDEPGADGIREGSLEVSLAVSDYYIQVGSMFTVVYCETLLTAQCANHNLVAIASAYFGDLGDGNGAPPAAVCSPADPLHPRHGV